MRRAPFFVCLPRRGADLSRPHPQLISSLTLSPFLLLLVRSLFPPRSFSATWGELIPGRDLPRSTEEAIAIKKKQLEDLKKQAAASGAGTGEGATYQTAYHQVEESAILKMRGKDPEAHLAAGFKVMKGGV